MKIIIDGQKKLKVNILTFIAQTNMWDRNWFCIEYEAMADAEVSKLYDSNEDSDTYGYFLMTAKQYQDFKDWWTDEIDRYNRRENSWFLGDNPAESEEAEYAFETYPEYEWIEEEID